MYLHIGRDIILKKEEIIKCFSEHYDKINTMLYGQKNTLK